ncbi:hypothetical protein HPB48_001643 [Haemaphysalis longicornis]|uniref:Ig-like domain-containing protein n=1 Tax=Haemaphysalis longicornis TaxID=44386 RepID=A0A9J6FXL1_HAELO|nr:hypothetical protein HPB48_001643 [Haemaphysalis longicornis]
MGDPPSSAEDGEQTVALELFPAHEEDEGLYRCRVDFRKARTRINAVMLKIIWEFLPSSLS